MKVGFIGLGNVGGKLAESLIRNKFDLTVRDLDKNLTKKFSDLGAIVAQTPKELAEKVDLVITCLPSPEVCVEVLGYHKDIPTLYASSHIICLPSYREGLPKSLIEAAAASRAVVTTDVPGCRDAIIPNKTGLLVPVKDPQKLADALQWLIEHPQERIAMGIAGRKLAEKEFSIEKIVQNHLDIYQDLLVNNSV